MLHIQNLKSGLLVIGTNDRRQQQTSQGPQASPCVHHKFQLLLPQCGNRLAMAGNLVKQPYEIIQVRTLASLGHSSRPEPEKVRFRGGRGSVDGGGGVYGPDDVGLVAHLDEVYMNNEPLGSIETYCSIWFQRKTRISSLHSLVEADEDFGRAGDIHVFGVLSPTVDYACGASNENKMVSHVFGD